MRLAIALTAGVALGCILLLLYANHAHLAVKTRCGSVVVPDRWLYIAVLLIIALITTCYLLGRKSS